MKLFQAWSSASVGYGAEGRMRSHIAGSRSCHRVGAPRLIRWRDTLLSPCTAPPKRSCEAPQVGLSDVRLLPRQYPAARWRSHAQSSCGPSVQPGLALGPQLLPDRAQQHASSFDAVPLDSRAERGRCARDGTGRQALLSVPPNSSTAVNNAQGLERLADLTHGIVGKCPPSLACRSKTLIRSFVAPLERFDEVTCKVATSFGAGRVACNSDQRRASFMSRIRAGRAEPC